MIENHGEFVIVSLNVSAATGTRKKPVESFVLAEGRGVSGDAHAGLIEERQVSFLAVEEIERVYGVRPKGRGAAVEGDQYLSEMTVLPEFAAASIPDSDCYVVRELSQLP